MFQYATLKVLSPEWIGCRSIGSVTTFSGAFAGAFFAGLFAAGFARDTVFFAGVAGAEEVLGLRAVRRPGPRRPAERRLVRLQPAGGRGVAGQALAHVRAFRRRLGHLAGDDAQEPLLRPRGRGRGRNKKTYIHKRIKLHDVGRVTNYIEYDIRKTFDEVLKEEKYLRGSHVRKFEEQWMKYTGAEECATVTNGTDALHTAGMVANIKPGDEVITCANTFVATVGAIAEIGAIPVFVDCDDTFCISVSRTLILFLILSSLIIMYSLFIMK